MPSQDKEILKQIRRRHYEKNREEIIRKNSQQRKEMRIWLKEYKSTLSCSLCPENHPSCIDFHHSDPNQKDIVISDCISNGWPKKRILSEISKCIIVCSNCHRKLHYKD